MGPAFRDIHHRRPPPSPPVQPRADQHRQDHTLSLLESSAYRSRFYLFPDHPPLDEIAPFPPYHISCEEPVIPVTRTLQFYFYRNPREILLLTDTNQILLPFSSYSPTHPDVSLPPLLPYRPLRIRMRSLIFDYGLFYSAERVLQVMSSRGYWPETVRNGPFAAIAAITYFCASRQLRSPQNIQHALASGKLSGENLILTCLQGPPHHPALAINTLRHATVLDVPIFAFLHVAVPLGFEPALIFSYRIPPLASFPPPIPPRNFIQRGYQLQLEEIPPTDFPDALTAQLTQALRDGTLL